MTKIRIKGRIIRILDKRTIIINLGSNDGINYTSVFSILGRREPVIDPETDEVLGQVIVVKSRVKASRVFDRFTVATTKWTESDYSYSLGLPSLMGFKTKEVDEGELLVTEADIQAWEARSEEPTKVGDAVQVTIYRPDEESDASSDEESEDT